MCQRIRSHKDQHALLWQLLPVGGAERNEHRCPWLVSPFLAQARTPFTCLGILRGFVVERGKGEGQEQPESVHNGDEKAKF